MVASTIEAPVASQPKSRRPSTRLIVDAVLAVGLFAFALVFRWHFPSDGLFYDDAWQAFGAVEGGFRQLFTVGQTQPGLGLELMVWSRVFGSSASTMIAPAVIAGSLGPPALYLTLRKFRYAVSISFLLGAALTVCETAIVYSGRVKSYTSDVLVILLLCVLLPWLARKRWTVAIAVAWFAGSVAIASYSSFTLLASIAAAAVLVFHAHGDRKVRILAVGAQAVALLGLFAAEDRTHNAAKLEDFFKSSESYIQIHLNPVTFGSEMVKHLVRVTDVFPGGPGWVSLACMIAAVVGLAVMARRGSMALVGRFLVLMVLLAIVGAIAKKVPFGPTQSTARVTLWLAPVVAFGLAVVLQRVYRAAAARGNATRLVFDVAAFGLSALLLASAIGVQRSYPSVRRSPRNKRWRRPAHKTSSSSRGRPCSRSDSKPGRPRRCDRHPRSSSGSCPSSGQAVASHRRPLDVPAKPDIISALKNTNRAYVVDSTVDPAGYKQYRSDLAALIASQGFKQQAGQTKVGTGRVTVWVRQGTATSTGMTKPPNARTWRTLPSERAGGFVIVSGRCANIWSVHRRHPAVRARSRQADGGRGMTSLPEDHRKALDAAGRIVGASTWGRCPTPRRARTSTCAVPRRPGERQLVGRALASGKTIAEVGDQFDGTSSATTRAWRTTHRLVFVGDASRARERWRRRSPCRMGPCPVRSMRVTDSSTS